MYKRWEEENKKRQEAKGLRLPKDKVILHLCASKYGSDTLDYVATGYDVRLITEEVDVRTYIPPKGVYGIIANPPCTEFSIAKTTAKRDLEKGMELVQACLKIIWTCMSELESDAKGARTPKMKFWALENPGTGMLRYFLGKPAFEYSPNEFGEDFTKRTALWGHFNVPVVPFQMRSKLLRRSVQDVFSPMTIRDRKERTDMRSIASPLFTKAFFNANL